MELLITLEIDNRIQNINVKPALYMDLPIWEVSMDDKIHILRKTEHGWDQGSDGGLKEDLLKKIGEAIDCSPVKDAG
ncbi:hypothetical protein WG906_00645 [Pedobacter sp. P351]|uniref:hypothetical protein n=1 Tax=Pedobacter superstes TaxID=3133441 RepID=UPI0030B12725